MPYDEVEISHQWEQSIYPEHLQGAPLNGLDEALCKNAPEMMQSVLAQKVLGHSTFTQKVVLFKN